MSKLVCLGLSIRTTSAPKSARSMPVVQKRKLKKYLQKEQGRDRRALPSNINELGLPITLISFNGGERDIGEASIGLGNVESGVNTYCTLYN